MTDRFKAISAALPLVAVVAIGMVYIRAWAVFRPYDPDWVTTLSAADVFSMGWAMTPTMLIAGAVGVIMGRASGQASRAGEPKPVRVWKIALFVTSALLLALSYALMMMPLGVRLSGRLLSLYPVGVLWLTLLHAHSAFRVTTSLSSFTRIVVLGGVAAMVAFWDWEAAAKLDRPTPKRITLDDGQEICSAVIFSGQNTLFLWDPVAERATALERRLVASVTKEPECRAAPRPPSSPVLTPPPTPPPPRSASSPGR